MHGRSLSRSAGASAELLRLVQVYEPIDNLLLAGQDPFNDFQVRGRIFTATGDSGQGITGGTTAGQVIAAAILNQRDPYKDVSVWPPLRVQDVSQHGMWLLALPVPCMGRQAASTGASIGSAMRCSPFHLLRACQAICLGLPVLQWVAAQAPALHGFV